MRTVAEGVEGEAQRGFLKARGCDELQGYLYSQPLDFAAFKAFLAGQRGSMMGASAAAMASVSGQPPPG